jgi:phosphate transport system substrate-binding protein
MKKIFSAGLILVAALVVGSVSMAETHKINGAGATFPFPVYSQWAYKYKNLTGTEINYQSIGSGGGIAQIKAKTVHFGASDAPLKPEELDEHGLIQFPMVMGGVVPVVNVKGVKEGQLKLTASVLADIYLGKISKWNDPSIKSLNPDLELPDKSITVVHRADGSGTTWIFTNYLMKVSSSWKEKVGFGKAVDWPTGVGGKGNEGVAAYVKRVNGAIGYVEFAYALQNKMSYARLENKAGHFVEPTIETFQAAAANAEWAKASGYYLVLTDQPGEQSWPITGATFILVYKEQANASIAKAMLKYFDWCYTHGGDVAENLHYVPMPKSVIEMVEQTWRNELKSDGTSLWTVSMTQ